MLQCRNAGMHQCRNAEISFIFHWNPADCSYIYTISIQPVMKAFIHSFIHSFAPLILLCCAFTLNAQVIQINQSFSSDTLLTPFTGSVPVYLLRMSGGINLYSDSSLVRVVLIDQYGNHYLVFETYPLITLENTFDTPQCLR